MVEPQGQQQMMAHTRSILDKQRLHACRFNNRPKLPGTNMHARTYTHTNIQYLLLFDCKKRLANAPQCHVIRTLSVLQFTWNAHVSNL